MKSETKLMIKFGVFLLMLIIIIIDFFVIRYLQKKIDNLTIITYQDSMLVKISPKAIEKPTILVTQQFVDEFNHYKSPFNDGRSFQELIEKYIRNRWADHYGCLRGTAEKRRIHEGIDLFVPENTPVYPLSGYGIVTEVSDNPHYLVEVDYKTKDGSIRQTKIEYGKTVRILYPEGIASIYTHLNEVYVQVGQEVTGDTMVGLTGLTGNIRNSGKPSHLHLELRDKNNKSFDPRHRLHYNQGSLEFFLEHLNL
jgi:murein DD-endopeptidase MepM/ murein hydrolase activator NlpD